MFAGSLVALVTPMQADGSVDKPRLGELLEWHIDQGTDAIVVNGTTGEAATLEPHEQQDLLRFTLDCINRRLPVIMGTGCNSTQRTAARTQTAFELGADACLVVTPYYTKPTQEGLYQHYAHVARNVAGPIILYNVPGRTACDLQPGTVKRLLSFSNIVGIKEALGNSQRYQELVELGDRGFSVMSGDDATALDLLRLGGEGVISVTANVAPAAVSSMCKAAFAGDWPRAEKIMQQLMGLNEALFLEANPIPVKWALHKMDKVENSLRLPLTTLSVINQAAVQSALERALIFERTL